MIRAVRRVRSEAFHEVATVTADGDAQTDESIAMRALGLKLGYGFEDLFASRLVVGDLPSEPSLA